ncbi:WD40 repeat domain-containing protein [Argonema galeatum A003/A1]|nr:WD40 repeat domain-containing protein [Argonema galeatum]MCL1463820.1 WD40 repeat domain-containing protein [Argonema galeatum A003/A1]
MAFQEEDEKFFFGRETFVDGLVRVVQQQPLVAVIGSSGSGKSSVVLAGLIPKLREAGSWLIESFRPNKQPFYELAAALISQLEPELGKTDKNIKAKELAASIRQHGFTADVSAILKDKPGKRLLLVIDQFEELYTGCTDTEQQQFVDALLAAVESASPAVTLVLTLRADFYSYVVNYPPFTEALNKYPAKNITLMKAEEMQAAIERPAEKMGVKLQEKLTQRILDDVKQEPGNLPLLEFALTQLWEKQSQGLLTHQAYSEIGGVAKALSNHAEAVYGKLSEQEQKQAQRIFLQLVRPGEGTEDTRRVATRGEVGEECWELIRRTDGLAGVRLVVTGRNEATEEKTVEVVHEALIREWGQLQEWIENDRAFLTWRHQLRTQMATWNSEGQDEEALLPGKPLVIAEDWLKKRTSDLINEREYIEQSLNLRQQEQEKQKRSRQTTISVLTVFSALALFLAGFAGVQWRQTQFQKQQLEISQGELRINYSNALFNEEGQQFDALIEALRGAKLLRSKANLPIEAVTALRQGIYRVQERNRLEGHSNWINSVTFSPDGKTLASGSRDTTIKLWDVKTGKLIRTIEHSGSIVSLSFSPDGKTLASGGGDNTIKLWNVNTGQEIKTLTKQGKYGFSISFSPDGKTLASGSEEKTIKIWDVKTGKEIITLNGHKADINSVSFSRDGKILASGSTDKSIKLWDVKTGKEIKTLNGHSDRVRSVSFSPDGKTLASGSDDNTIKIWNVATGKEIKTLSGHNAFIYSVSFSPDGKTLASGSDDNTMKLWNVATGEETINFNEHKDSISSVSFSPDGKTLASGSFDKTIKIWNVSIGEEKSLKGHKDSIFSVSFSPDGKTLASGGFDNTIKLWNVDTGKAKTLKGHKDAIQSLSFSPDGKTLASGSRDKTIKLWNVATGKVKKTLNGHSNTVYSVSFSHDGKTLASGSADKTIKLWDVAKGKEIKTLNGHSDEVNSVSFSHDGKTLASGSDDKTIKLWDVAKGKEIKTLNGHDSLVYSVSFSPDGKTLASGSDDKTIKLWNIDTGEKIRTLNGHSDSVRSVSFSPDGKTLASGSDDKTIQLWDVDTGKKITIDRDSDGHSEAVNSVSFSADGKTLASGSGDTTVILWNLDFDDLLVRSCNWMRPYLQNNPNVSKSDKQLCDGIGTKK